MQVRAPLLLPCLLGLVVLTLGIAPPKELPPAPGMTPNQLTSIIRSASSEAKGEGNVIQFVYEGVRMACIFDVTYGRMRIIAPIKSTAELTAPQVAAALDANFHAALDARYATSDGVLYAAYIHPLGPLRTEDVLSALRQVSSLVTTFGTTYSSGELEYGQQP